MAQLFGTSVPRREDPRLITGHGLYTGDVELPGMLYAAFARSQRPHAQIVVDVTRARSMPGVATVLTAQDLAGHVGLIPAAWLVPDSALKTTPRPALAEERVRYVGEPLALVVADTRAHAQDAALAVHVRYETLPHIVSARQALEADAPQLFEDIPANEVFHWRAGSPAEETDRAIEDAPVSVRTEVINQRLIPMAMEPRAMVADFNPGSGELTLWATTQNPHILRFLVSGALGLGEQQVRVIAPDVGGGFGSKIPFYPEDAAVAYASRLLGRPVRWTEERSEGFLSTTHGRDQIQELTLAGRMDGTLLALRIRAIANMGAYLSTAAPAVPTVLFGLITAGAYHIPLVHVDVTGAVTNTTPTDAYRGAGRPEATFAIERLVDLFAAKVHMDPAEIRRHNFVPKDAFPYTAATGLTYDSGNYEGALDKALEIVEYAGLRRLQEGMRREGRYLGIGLSSYVEVCGLAPSKFAAATGFQGGLWDSATIRVHPSGKVTVLTGISPHGQGEETTFAQIVADRLGVPFEDVDVVHGDTARVSMGWGTYGSRSTTVGGGALAQAADRIMEKARLIAAHLLEAEAGDIDFTDGRLHVRGVPTRSVTLKDVALAAHLAWDLPKGVEPGLEASSAFDPADLVYPFGTHIAVVEIDPRTGVTTLKRYVAVDDCGRVINPMIVEGQVHGGIAQGVGQALWEGALYDSDGQLVTGSLTDYAVPKASNLPVFELARTETPSPHNPLGVKGIGETGAIASTPAVVNAVLDALRPIGVEHLDMPLTPERVWRAIEAAREVAAAREERSDLLARAGKAGDGA